MSQGITSSSQPGFQRGNRRKIGAAVVGAVVLVGASLVGWKVWASRAPRLDASRDDLAKYVASDKFDKLSKDQQKQYTDAMMKKPLVITEGSQIPDEQLAAARRLGDQARQDMIDGYYKLTDATAKRAYLDNIINQQEDARKMMEEAQKAKPGDGKMRVMIKGGGGAAAQKQNAETTPPAIQAQLAGFMKDVNDRRAERGMSPSPGLMIVRINHGA
jgi:hypothetical protein